jgi:hypothetical protein
LKHSGVGFGARRPVVGNSEILLPVAIEIAYRLRTNTVSNATGYGKRRNQSRSGVIRLVVPLAPELDFHNVGAG